MSNTARYGSLSGRIAVIEYSYLPATNPDGSYSDKDQDDLRAYLLLIHAEIEAYFEEVAESKVKDIFNKWKADRTKSNVLVSLVSFCENTITDKNIEQRVNKALSLYIEKLKRNHGIKEINILDILLPLGIEYQDIDNTWLNIMTSFGTDRGKIAHSAAAVLRPLDPISIKNTVTLILDEIKKIDENIEQME